ncbi:MAG: FliI/YscN family ATPase [Fimbriimonadaceae bacterium]|nr:FliI/YscN family ATPase [Fimbriimonadaceae bacterium]QYK54703.1 MAG: FliI/YscN family ATPase [Fimbriimonadaceae bacterium]
MGALSRLGEAILATSRFEALGRVEKVVGLVLESDGPGARIGEVCIVEPEDGAEPLPCEVVGFRGSNVLLMPLGDMAGVQAGNLVRGTGTCLRVPVGHTLLGRVVNGLGKPIDGKGPLNTADTYPILAPPPNALSRQMISQPFATGVRAIDGCLTIGVGQRMGIFAGSGVGKSTLLGMIAREGQADVNVVALIGERGREVREFIERDLGKEGMRRTVVVCATSDEPALVRIKASLTATAIAEAFRDQGLEVLLMMDSVTRFAMAQREVGLAVGEPPSAKGYTPSVFALLPKLMERTGCGERGAITAIYTVLVDGDDTNEPIADATRSILDGHIVLNRRLTSRGHYPPIDVGQSLSRVMPMVVDQQQVRQAARLRELIAAYSDVEDLVSVGAYKPGTRPDADFAIERWDALNAFLRQGREDGTPFAETQRQLAEVVGA